MSLVYDEQMQSDRDSIAISKLGLQVLDHVRATEARLEQATTEQDIENVRAEAQERLSSLFLLPSNTSLYQRASALITSLFAQRMTQVRTSPPRNGMQTAV